MQNSYKNIWLAENYEYEIESTKNKLGIQPPASITIMPSSKKSGHSSSLLSKPASIPTSLQFEQTQLHLSALSERKARLEDECARLDIEILSKQQMLKQLQGPFEAAINDYQASSASKIAAGLAHEIRNPLTTIKGFIQLLKPDLEAIGKEEFADVVLEEINRVNSLLSEFLSIFKPSSSGKSKLSLNTLSKALGNLFASEAILKEVELKIEVPDDEVFVWADEKQLKQVALNLLKNAFEAIEESDAIQGEITIVVNKIGHDANFSIIDNGAGLNETDATKIFTPFYTTKEKGTGIGLVICKQIIEEHGGKLKVETETDRTRFFFELPAI